jgi:hypothetical protein
MGRDLIQEKGIDLLPVVYAREKTEIKTIGDRSLRSCHRQIPFIVDAVQLIKQAFFHGVVSKCLSSCFSGVVEQAD